MMEANHKVETWLQQGQFDFIDFGCSEGGSFKIAQNIFQADKGLGIDADPKKVETARAAGFDVYQADITKLERFSGSVRFVTMNHFLEHLNDVRDAKKCIVSACELAREFVFIKQPFFDADPYLLSNGLQFYWSHWGCHLNHMTSLDFFHVLQPMLGNGVDRFAIYGVRRVKHSADPAIHSLRSPVDQHAWEVERHPPKKPITFDQDVFYEIAAIVVLQGQGEKFFSLERSFHWDKKLFDSEEFESGADHLLGLPYEWNPARQSLQLSGHIDGAKIVEADLEGEVGTGMSFRAIGNDPILLLPERKLSSGAKIIVDAELTVPCASDAQLFFQTREKRSYVEQNSLKQATLKGRNRIRFELSADRIHGRLRLDPGRAPGEYVLHQLRIHAR